MSFTIHFIISALMFVSGQATKFNYTTQGEECFGPCDWRTTLDGPELQCVTVGHLNLERCSKNPTTDFKGKPCLSKCGRETNTNRSKIVKNLGSHAWCRSESSLFSFCSPIDSTDHYQTIGSLTGKLCISSCGTHSLTNYTWCRTGFGEDDEEMCSYLPNYSFDMQKCTSPCKKISQPLSNGLSPYTCLIKPHQYSFCSPVWLAVLQDEYYAQSNCLQNPNLCRSHFEAYKDFYGSSFITVTERGSVRKIYVKNYDGDNWIPTITYSDIQGIYNISGRFNKRDSDQQMIFMHNKTGDEKGHLVGRQLGGPAITLNMAPQTCKINRPGGEYTVFENNLASILKQSPGYSLRHWVFLNYNFPYRRPFSFYVCANLIDQNGNYLRTFVSFVSNGEPEV